MSLELIGDELYFEDHVVATLDPEMFETVRGRLEEQIELFNEWERETQKERQ